MTLNVDNILTLSSVLKDLFHAGQPLPEYEGAWFYMFNVDIDSYAPARIRVEHKCETAGCIIGWTDAVFHDAPYDPMKSENRFVAALGLSSDQGDMLSMPVISNPDPSQFESDEFGELSWEEQPDTFSLGAAISTLDHLAETGQVDWAYGLMNPYTGEDR